MSDDDRLARLERIEGSLAIQQLAARYSMAVDERDLDALAALYVDDVDYGEKGRGPDGVKAYFRAVTRAFYRSFHHIGGHSYEFVDESHAVGRVYCRAEHERQDRWIVADVCYFDSYVKRNGSWLFEKPRRVGIYYTADLLERPQTVNFQRSVMPGASPNKMRMMPHHLPSWADFWDAEGADAVAEVTFLP